MTTSAWHTGPAPHQPKPEYGDAGYDLALSEGVDVHHRGVTYAPTGTAVQLPKGWWGLLVGRSSAEAKWGVRVTTGIIDNGWRGELLVGIQAHHGWRSIPEGTRLAQIIPMLQAPKLEWIEVDELTPHLRGKNGFGSTT